MKPAARGTAGEEAMRPRLERGIVDGTRPVREGSRGQGREAGKSGESRPGECSASGSNHHGTEVDREVRPER